MFALRRSRRKVKRTSSQTFLWSATMENWNLCPLLYASSLVDEPRRLGTRLPTQKTRIFFNLQRLREGPAGKRRKLQAVAIAGLTNSHSLPLEAGGVSTYFGGTRVGNAVTPEDRSCCPPPPSPVVVFIFYELGLRPTLWPGPQIRDMELSLLGARIYEPSSSSSVLADRPPPFL